MPSQHMLTLEAAATHLGCSASTVKRRIDRGELEAVKVGKAVRIPASALPDMPLPVGEQLAALLAPLVELLEAVLEAVGELRALVTESRPALARAA